MLKKQEIIQKIAMADVVVQGKESIVSDMNGDMVMLNIHTGKYYNLGTIGGEIWNAIGTPTVVSELIHRLECEYDVEQAECEEQVLSYLHQLLSEGLIELERKAVAN